MHYHPDLSSSTSSLPSPYKPSLFDLYAATQLNSLLPPTLRYLLTLLTHRYPRYLLRILNSFDEVYALLSLLVEKYYLTTFGGGFVENFYGLKRERVVRVKGGELPRTVATVPGELREKIWIGRSRKDVWKNLVVMVGVPYLKRKLDEAFDVYIAPHNTLIAGGISSGGDDVVTGRPRYSDPFALPPNPTLRQRLQWSYKWFLRKIYPSLNALYFLTSLAFSMGYLFEGTKYASPFLWLVGTRLRRLDAEDIRAFAKDAEEARAVRHNVTGSNLGWRGIFDGRLLYTKALSSLKLFLPASIFALKFLEWWHASDFSRQLSKKASEGLELPPPIITGMGRGRSTQPEADNPLKAEQWKDSTLPTSLPPHGEEGEADTQSTSQFNLSRSQSRLPPAPISLTTHLPILTVPAPPTTDLCPICLDPITNPTACQTGYVYDYKCIFQWIEGTHERQKAWMGNGDKVEGEERWDDEDDDEEEEEEKEDRNTTTSGMNTDDKFQRRPKRRREEGKESESEGERERGRRGWESGAGRCAVTGRRVLGGSAGLRRVMV